MRACVDVIDEEGEMVSYCRLPVPGVGPTGGGDEGTVWEADGQNLVGHLI